MYKLDSLCLCCSSTDVIKKPAKLSKFLVWRSTKNKQSTDIDNQIVICNNCNFAASELRLDANEEINLYDQYRGTEYNQQRIICEPDYKEKISFFEDFQVTKLRKETIFKFISNYIDTQQIKSVLDYGGDRGQYISEYFSHCKKYIYEISDLTPLEGIEKIKLNNEFKVDLLMCCQVLEHISNLDLIMHNFKKYMHDRTCIYIDVPSYKNPIPNNIVVGEHLNFFSEASLKRLFDKHNIKTISIKDNKDLSILSILGIQSNE